MPKSESVAQAAEAVATANDAIVNRRSRISLELSDEVRERCDKLAAISKGLFSMDGLRARVRDAASASANRDALDEIKRIEKFVLGSTNRTDKIIESASENATS